MMEKKKAKKTKVKVHHHSLNHTGLHRRAGGSMRVRKTLNARWEVENYTSISAKVSGIESVLADFNYC